MNLSKRFICPMCHWGGPWGDMVKHVAYAGDSQHEQWRINHGFPARITFGTHNKFKPSLPLAVVSEFPQ